ncbi:MAG: efflux RND transporter permease subunit, partial [Planctomycetia bacterium]
MFSRFFIDRPVFATVLAVVVVILGGVAAPQLPIAQYPDVTPPLVSITTSYPGAGGQIVSDTVATPIEQQVNGVDDMLYMESTATADGSMTLNVTFDIGTDPNTAQVLSQNRVAMAEAQLPDVVQKQGVVTQKSNPSILVAVQLFSPDERYDGLFLSNYFKIQIYDELLRIPGVGQVTMLGARDYSMRVWLDPEKLAARDLVAMDVYDALQEQNVEVAAGMLGQPPAPTGQDAVFLVNTVGRLTDVKQFEEIVVKTGSKGELIRLSDVGRVELGTKTYSQESTLDGKPAVTAAVFQLPGTNAIAIADQIYARMAELKKKFPEGLDYGIYYDTTLFIRSAAAEVFWTLIESSALVALVIFIFLQNWRSAIIPIVSLPVSIIGAFAIMAGFGFSFNNLSLFGLVLAIGIVVDDAIVVVENVERNLDLGLTPREAAHRAMEEISGAIFAVTLVLSCVF